jgi:branched-subunit amino acid ABC-type transport system permease component
MMAPVYFVDPWIGGKPLFTALLAIVIGGLGSFKGAVIGGLILGFVSSVIAYYIGPWSEMISFLAVIFIILFMPQGLFGQAEARA